MTEELLPALPTTVIGSYPRPGWLKKIKKAWEAGRAKDEDLEEAMNDAVVAVVREQETVGIDIPSDGEQRRDEMVEHFARRIGGFKFYGPVRVWGNNFFNKPAVVSELRYPGPIVLDEFLFLRKVSSRKIVKVTVTGPYTIADWSFNEYYSTKEELAGELAKIINMELRTLAEHGASYIQVDEPALTTHPDEVEWAIDVINEATEGVNAKIGLHVCYSNYWLLVPFSERLKSISQLALEFANRRFQDLGLLRKIPMEIGLGVVDVHSKRVESPEEVAHAIKKALELMPVDYIYVNPDCGLKLLPRSVAREKLRNMVLGAEMVRRELARRGITSTPFRLRV